MANISDWSVNFKLDGAELRLGLGATEGSILAVPGEPGPRDLRVVVGKDVWLPQLAKMAELRLMATEARRVGRGDTAFEQIAADKEAEAEALLASVGLEGLTDAADYLARRGPLLAVYHHFKRGGAANGDDVQAWLEISPLCEGDRRAPRPLWVARPVAVCGDFGGGEDETFRPDFAWSRVSQVWIGPRWFGVPDDPVFVVIGEGLAFWTRGAHRYMMRYCNGGGPKWDVSTRVADSEMGLDDGTDVGREMLRVAEHSCSSVAEIVLDFAANGNGDGSAHDARRRRGGGNGRGKKELVAVAEGGNGDTDN